MKRNLSAACVLFMAFFFVAPVMLRAAEGGAEFRQRISAGEEMVASDITEEVRFGREVAARVLGRFGLLRDPNVTRYVNLVGQAIARNTNRPELEFHFAVLNTDEINAYAAPGGYIFVTRGALSRMRDESELAGVLAHEVGHVVEKHAVRELRIKGSDDAVTAGLATIIGGGSQSARAAFAQAVDQALELLFKNGYRREDEAQADKDAVLFCALAGYEPSGLVNYFERLAPARGTQTAVLDKTHPPFESRIAWLRNAIAWEGIDTGSFRRNEERFAASIKQAR